MFEGYLLLGLLIIFIVLLIVTAIWVFSIWYGVKHTQKRPMFYCKKHGLMTADSTIRFMDSVEIVDTVNQRGQPEKTHIEHGVKYCPRCFNDRYLD